MIKSPALRVSPGPNGISIWSSELFGNTEAARLRDFVARAFSVREVNQLDLRPAKSFGRIRYERVVNPAPVWRKLSHALRASGAVAPLFEHDGAPTVSVDSDLVYLDGPVTNVRVSRIDGTLTTWHLQGHSDNTLRLAHPFLRNRRDVAFRLEEELAAIFGVQDFRVSAVTGRVSVRFDSRVLTVGRLTRELETAWPRLRDGLDGPPSKKRFAAAIGLAGLAFTGQYLVPAVKPLAIVGVTLYGAPNVANAAKDLTRGEVGVSALYSTGLVFMLISGTPLASTVMATLMQLWPHLSRRKVVRSQRRLFADQRRRPTWVRLAQADGSDVEVHIDDLSKDGRVVVRTGEVVPVDGVVEEGFAAVVEEAPFGAGHIEDRSTGDTIAAGAFVRDGSLTIRVRRAGTQTSASYVDSLLPHAAITGMPSSFEAERIANRNAKPALALAAVSLLVTQTPRVARTVIRPDYATAPRLSSQLSALHGIAQGLHRGVLFRDPSALERIARADVYVFDDSAGLDRRRVEVATVKTVSGVATELVVGYALAAHRYRGTEQSAALESFAAQLKTVDANARALSRHAGVTRYHDGLGSLIEVVTPEYLAASGAEVPTRLQSGAGKRSRVWNRRGGRTPADVTDDQPSLRSLWVLREGIVIGVVSFARTGELLGRGVLAALAAQNKRAKLVYLSQRADADVHALCAALGITDVRAGLRQPAKVEAMRALGERTLWVGDGASLETRTAIAASTVSVSVASWQQVRQDTADILVPYAGFSGLPDVIHLGHAHAKRLSRDYRALYVANLLGVTGAFAVKLTSLHAGLLSNLCAALIYTRHARGLDQLTSTIETRHKRLRLPA